MIHSAFDAIASNALQTQTLGTEVILILLLFRKDMLNLETSHYFN